MKSTRKGGNVYDYHIRIIPMAGTGKGDQCVLIITVIVDDGRDAIPRVLNVFKVAPEVTCLADGLVIRLAERGMGMSGGKYDPHGPVRAWRNGWGKRERMKMTQIVIKRASCAHPLKESTRWWDDKLHTYGRSITAKQLYPMALNWLDELWSDISPSCRWWFGRRASCRNKP